MDLPQLAPAERTEHQIEGSQEADHDSQGEALLPGTRRQARQDEVRSLAGRRVSGRHGGDQSRKVRIASWMAVSSAGPWNGLVKTVGWLSPGTGNRLSLSGKPVIRRVGKPGRWS